MKHKLYKMDAVGRIRSWGYEVQDDLLLIEHGLVDGFKQHERISHSTPEEEGASRYRHKRDREGYTTYIPRNVPQLPMLAVDYEENWLKLPDSIFIQPKLDGIRCLGRAAGLKSRKRTEITSCPHILGALQALPPEIILDGEIYCHGMPIEQISGMVRRHYPHQLFHKLQYHVFDIYDLEKTQGERLALAKDIVSSLNGPVLFVDTKKVPYVRSELPEANKYFTDQGYEGSILRNPLGYYEPNKRSHFLQKYKDFKDGEFLVTGFVEGEGSARGTAIAVCQTKEGYPFKCALKMSDNNRRQIWQNQQRFIGQYLHVRFIRFTQTEKPVPYHAQGIIFHKHPQKM